MPRKTFTPEQIVGKLRQIEVLVSQGKTVPTGLQGRRDRRADVLPLAERIWRPAVGTSQEAEGPAKRECAIAACSGRSDGREAGRPGKRLSPDKPERAHHTIIYIQRLRLCICTKVHDDGRSSGRHFVSSFLVINVAISFLRHSPRNANHALEKTNTALQDAVRQLSRSDAEFEGFCFTVAHDLLEPLRSIRATTQLFLSRHEGALDQDSAEMLGFVVKGADRMKTLILDVLEFAKMNHAVTASQVDARAVVESALRYLQEAIDQSGAKITINSLPVVQMNEEHLFRLFLNLVGNAIKYCGEMAPDIHISASPRGEQWVFSVGDNGIGIDSEYHDQIFDPFHRLHDQSKYEGSGVGLAICRRIVERYHGRIWVESQPGRGSTFSFTIPSAKISETP
jgi:signal transduction histidine kinase